MAQDGRNNQGRTASGTEAQRMPAGVRRGVLAGIALLLAGALYLIAVRGEALLVDLSQLGQAIIACF